MRIGRCGRRLPITRSSDRGAVYGCRILLALLFAVAAAGCNKDEFITQEIGMAPVVAFDANPAIYTVKVGREFTIAPDYRYVDRAVYAWKLESTGKIVSTDPQLVYRFDRTQRTEDGKQGYYMNLQVTTPEGSVTEPLFVEVLEQVPPVIAFPGGQRVEVTRGRRYTVSPDVRGGETAAYRWTLLRPGATDPEPVGEGATYEFCEREIGLYRLRLQTENEDGRDDKTLEVNVVKAVPVTATVAPVGRKYDGLTRTVALGRSTTLRPYVWNRNDPSFRWTIDGRVVSTDPSFTYTPTGKGRTAVLFTVTDTVADAEDETTCAELEFTVECCDAEGTHRRPASETSEATWTKVYEYTPAPGQFINERVSGGFVGSETSPEAAVAYAEDRLKKGTWVSLGGWGGYIVVGFDHSIDNAAGYRDGYNFSITGNAFEGSSEPGIVYVMQDTNGNGFPDDEWIQLKGSEFGKPETIEDYAVTYYRPDYSGADVQWKDNRGAAGRIDYLKQYHDQPSYYPAWIDTESYTLYGTCLKHRTYDRSGNGTYWVNGEYDWGYADNLGSDRLSDDDNAAAGALKIYFKISNAVDADGNPADLAFIDFIKVQTGVNMKAGWLGENSTEVFGFTDENLNRGR